MKLAYQAVDAKGKRSADTVEAGSTADALEALRRRGLFVTQISDVHSLPPAQGRGRQSGGRTRSLSLKALVLFTRQMAMLLRAGSGLVPALQAISRQTTAAGHRAVIGRLIADLEGGSTLTEAVEKHPATFDPVYCAIIAAGEASATLSKVFDRLAPMLSRQRTMRKKVLGTLAYPCLLICMCANIMLVLVFFVLPRFADMFVQLGVEPPASTKALLAVGKAVSGYWWAMLLAAAGAASFGAYLPRTAWGKQWLSDVQLRIPVIGRLRGRIIQAQILRTMGLLVQSRVALLEALALVQRSTRNARFRKLFNDLETAVSSGGNMSTAFEQSGLVEPAVCQAIRTGEESGNVAEALLYCADVLDENNEELINVFARLIEPVILLGMGAVVGGVAISLFLPLFDLTSAIR